MIKYICDFFLLGNASLIGVKTKKCIWYSVWKVKDAEFAPPLKRKIMYLKTCMSNKLDRIRSYWNAIIQMYIDLVQHSHKFFTPLSNILTFFTRIYWKGIQINVTCLVSYCTVKEKGIIYNNVMFMKLPNYFDYTVHFRLNLITFIKGVLLCLNLFFFLQGAKVFFKLRMHFLRIGFL